jgi:hypothetical protein
MRVDGWQSLFSWTIIEPAPPEDFSQKNEKKTFFFSFDNDGAKVFILLSSAV